MEHLENYNHVEADDNLPGVHLPEPDESAKIPGVGSTDQDLYEDVTDLVDAYDVNNDFKFRQTLKTLSIWTKMLPIQGRQTLW